MSKQARPGAVIYAKNIARVSAFYTGVFGFDVTHSEDAHVVLESPLFQLIIVAIPANIAASIELASPPIRRTDTPIKLAFFVASIRAARVAASRLGGELNGADREWQFDGCTVCDGHDPEGNVVQFREIAC